MTQPSQHADTAFADYSGGVRRCEEVWWIGGRSLKGGSRSPAPKPVAGLSHQRPAGTPGASPASLSKGRRTGQRLRRQRCRGIERIRASQSRCDIFPTGRIVSVLWGGGEGVSGARHGLRHDREGRCRKVKSAGERGRERAAEKAAGDECVFIPSKGRAGR